MRPAGFADPRPPQASATHAAMEATGVCWRPVWHVVPDGEVSPVLAHAAQVRNVPGRKTDVADAAWLAEVLAAIRHMLGSGIFRHDLGRDRFHRRSPEQQARHLGQQITKLGVACSFGPRTAGVSVQASRFTRPGVHALPRSALS